MYDNPDKLLIEYPIGNLVLDTGWRGSSSYNGSPLHPGGIVVPGHNIEPNIFSRLTANFFRATVIGPGPGTEWKYKVRCH